MKETQRLMKGLVACGVAIAMVSTLAAQTTDQMAKVVRIKGSARYSTTGTSDWKPLKVGAELAPGTLIQTDVEESSSVDLVLGQVANENEVLPVAYNSSASSSSGSGNTGHEAKATQNIIHLSSNTLLSIDKLTQMQTGGDVSNETELDLRTGTIIGRVKKVSAGSRFEIKVPNGVAAIRGTDFLIATIDLSHERGGRGGRGGEGRGGERGGVLGVQVWVSNGSVVLSWSVAGNPNPITQVIRPGQGCSTITGVVEMLTPAQIGTLNRDIQQFINPVLAVLNIAPIAPISRPQQPPPVISGFR